MKDPEWQQDTTLRDAMEGLQEKLEEKRVEFQQKPKNPQEVCVRVHACAVTQYFLSAGPCTLILPFCCYVTPIDVLVPETLFLFMPQTD